MIENNYTTLFVTYRAVWTQLTSEEAEVGQFFGHIQEASTDLVVSLGLTLTKPYMIWCAVSEDVKAGDTLNSTYGKFSVKGVRKFELGTNRHLELVANLDEVVGS